MTERLTTLQAVKDWLDISNTVSDSQLTRLIDSASRFVFNYLQRDTFSTVEHTDLTFQGNGKDRWMLPFWPVISVSSVGMNGTNIPASEAQSYGKRGSGFQVQKISPDANGPAEILLWGYQFVYRAPCIVSFVSGYQTTETDVLAKVEPTDTTILVTPTTSGQWIADIGVTIDGVDAVKVDADPTAGQYSVDAWGTYTFSADDDTKTVVITYNYCPWDVAFACTQLIGEWWRRKDRIGVLSKTLGGQETITFSQKDMTDSIRGMLGNYIRVAPL